MLELIQKSGGSLKAVNNIAMKLSENLGKRIILSLAEKGQELFTKFFLELDEIGASLERVIPQGRKFQALIDDIATGSNSAYLNFGDVGNSVISLNTHFTEFNRLVEPQQKELITMAANLEKLGVDTDLFAENLNIMNKSMGFSVSEFQEFQEDLRLVSQQLGINMNTLNKNFQTSSGRLSQFEKTKVPKIFKELVAVSKDLRN